MNRDDYIALLNRALASPYGIRLDYGDDRAARLVRGKLYRIREETREEARGKPVQRRSADLIGTSRASREQRPDR